jgi:hypothetical protein
MVQSPAFTGILATMSDGVDLPVDPSSPLILADLTRLFVYVYAHPMACTLSSSARLCIIWLSWKKGCSPPSSVLVFFSSKATSVAFSALLPKRHCLITLMQQPLGSLVFSLHHGPAHLTVRLQFATGGGPFCAALPSSPMASSSASKQNNPVHEIMPHDS